LSRTGFSLSSFDFAFEVALAFAFEVAFAFTFAFHHPRKFKT
jgi:hypothetical protein